MKTTLIIDDRIMSRLKSRAAREGKTMSELVESALRLLLQARADPGAMPELPDFSSGGALVDVSDRNALYRAMEDL